MSVNRYSQRAIDSFVATSTRRSSRRRAQRVRRDRRNIYLQSIALLMVVLGLGWGILRPEPTRAGAGTPAPKTLKASTSVLPRPQPSAMTWTATLSDEVPYSRTIRAAADAYRLDAFLLAALIRQESNFDPQALSPAAAAGLTQMIPATAAAMGVTDPYDPTQSIWGGARYLRRQLDTFGSVPLTLAAYNAGPNAVKKYAGVPPYPETQAYVAIVQEYRKEFLKQAH